MAIHWMTFSCSHHDNTNVRGCLEECIRTVSFSVTVLRQLDLLDLVIGVIDRVQLICNSPILQEPALVNALECKSYIDTNREVRLDFRN